MKLSRFLTELFALVAHVISLLRERFKFGTQSRQLAAGTLVGHEVLLQPLLDCLLVSDHGTRIVDVLLERITLLGEPVDFLGQARKTAGIRQPGLALSERLDSSPQFK